MSATIEQPTTSGDGWTEPTRPSTWDQLGDAAERITQPGPVFSLLVTALGFASVASSGALNVMWADDGVFLARTLNEGPLATLTFAHQGYLNLGQMTVAAALEPVPLRLAPVAYVAAWAVVVGLLVSLAAGSARSLLMSHWSRVVLGVGFAVIPIAGAESAGSVANLQWYLLAALMFVLAGRPRGRIEWSAAAVVAFFAAASAPAAVVFAPVIWWRRERRWIAGAWALGTVLQLATIAQHWGTRDDVGFGLAVDRSAQAFVSVSLNGIMATFPPLTTLMPLAVVGLVVMAAGIVQHPDRMAVFVPLVVVVALQWAFTYAGNAGHPTDARYGIGAALAAVAVLLGAAESNRRLHVSVVAVLAVCWAGTFGVSHYRAAGPDWSEQVRALECVNGEAAVRVAPVKWDQPITIPC